MADNKFDFAAITIATMMKMLLTKHSRKEVLAMMKSSNLKAMIDILESEI